MIIVASPTQVLKKEPRSLTRLSASSNCSYRACLCWPTSTMQCWAVGSSNPKNVLSLVLFWWGCPVLQKLNYAMCRGSKVAYVPRHWKNVVYTSGRWRTPLCAEDNEVFFRGSTIWLAGLPASESFRPGGPRMLSVPSPPCAMEVFNYPIPNTQQH